MKTLKIAGFGIMMIGFATATQAEVTDHPCAKIRKACTDAGFAKGEAKEGKGLYKNCMKPLLEGKTVEGVKETFDAGTLQACHAKQASWKEHKETH
jgi:hypothetical protein